MTWVLSLLSVGGVSLVSLLGLLTLPFEQARLRSLAAGLMSFAVGALLGDAFLHLLPVVFASGGPALGPSLAVLGGMLVFFVLEKLLRHRRGALQRGHHRDRAPPVLAAVNLVGDGVHNFVDGLLIGASYLAGPELGLSTTVAVLFHEIPQELGDFGVLVHSGLGARRAVLLNLASAGAAVAGTVVALLAGSHWGNAVAAAALPVTAGGFLYIAAADLIPELQQDRTLRGLAVQASAMAAGIAVMALLTRVE